MFRIFQCVAIEHDPRILLLALLLCFFASSTAILMGQRALKADASERSAWLLAAGLVTGFGIWTTHFSAMLAFEPGANIRFEVRYTSAALFCAIAFSIVGWTTAFGRDRARPVLGGTLIGLGLAGAHFLDTFGICFAGTLTLDADLALLSIPLGVSLCGLSAYLLARHQKPGIPLSASAALAAGIFSLHIVAMSSLVLTADPRVPEPTDGLSLNALGSWIIAGALSILAAGFALVAHDRYSAAIIAEERRQLAASLEALKESQAHYIAALELNPQIPWTADTRGQCLEIGPRWSEFLGLPVEEALGMGWVSVVHPEDTPKVEALWHEATRTGQPFDARYRFRCLDGSYRWFRDRGYPRRNASGEIIKWYGSVEDIHDQVVAEETLRATEERYRLASNASTDAIWDWSHTSQRITWSGAVGSHFGYYEAVEGTSFDWWSERVHADDRARILDSLKMAISGDTTHWSEEYRFRKADGTYANILSRGTIVRGTDTIPLRSIGAMIDITQLKRAEASVRWAAQHDSLTNLPNRSLFEIRLRAALDSAGRDASEVGLVVLDVDYFKLFNDTRGHHAGDQLLSWIAGRLQERRLPETTVARLGGDEFAVIIPGYKEGDAGKALAGLQEPFHFRREAIDVGVSAGLAVWPHDAKRPENLIKCADLALYACKAERQKGVQRFQPKMRKASSERARMLDTASAALRENRIFPYYQAKVCLQTGTLVGMEALLRWRHPERGVQSPASIVAAFDNAEIATSVTDRIVDWVLSDIKVWLQESLNFGRIAINASAADFLREDFDVRLLHKLEHAGVPANCLELEVTENVLVGRNPDRVLAMLNTLKRAGITIALDDFGTGYASLSHLNAFPVDVVKIDQSFVRPLGDAQCREEAIVRAVIGLARDLGILTVAEGVETPEQAVRLGELRCDVLQGYLFSVPTPSENVPHALTHALLQGASVVKEMPTKRSLEPAASFRAKLQQSVRRQVRSEA
jgi:diguanylate cyclase (GGDEF)-like protein/PAS domain S-box-containing protein